MARDLLDARVVQRTALSLVFLLGACEAAETDSTNSTDGTDGTEDGGDESDVLDLDTCPESIAGGVAPFYQQYFACSDIEVGNGATVARTDGLPPHPSPYYETDHANYVPFDDRGGTHNQNPGVIGEGNYEIVIPDNPTPKGVVIDASMVDNTMNTSAEEYSGGPVGIALDGVVIFAAMAAPGDDLAREQFTFDLYEGHPAGETYHYHFNTPGPLEVLVAFGHSDNATPGAGSVELYGIMCDGTVVLGCTELDGSVPTDADFDAQNGHVHDLGDGAATHFTDRYHTHVCPSRWPDYPFFPEIAYYDTSGCPVMGP